MTVEVSQEEIAAWTKAQTQANGFQPSLIKDDGTKDIARVFICSESYPQQNRMGWKCRLENNEDAPFTFFNIYPESYHMAPKVDEAREKGTPIPVVFNIHGKAILLRPEDTNPTHPKAIARAKSLADGKINRDGTKKEQGPAPF